MQQPPGWSELPLTYVVAAVKSRVRQVAWRLLAPHSLSPQQFQVLLAVAEREGASHGDIVRRTWMDKPTASRVIHALEERGLLQVEADPEHGRRLRLLLTPRARPLVAELEVLRGGIREGLERGLSGDERREVRRILGAVLDNLDRMEAEASTVAP